MLQFQQAELAFRAAVAIDGRNADYYNNLGTVVGSRGVLRQLNCV